MNAHLPQSIEAATELREIAAVPLQIVSPRESTPIVSVVQDTLVGANRFTRSTTLFTLKEAMNLLVHAKRWDGVLPPPVTKDPQPMWSGQQLLSTLLPPVSLEMQNSSFSDKDKGKGDSPNLVKILNGHMLQGILDKSVFSKQLLHIIYNDYGPSVTVDFLDSLQAMIASFLMNSGFSVGISDLIADSSTNAEIGVALNKLTKTIEDQILQLHTGLFENSSGRSNHEEFEGKVMSTLNKAVGEAGKIGLQSLADANRMTNMIKAGSKGSDVNVSQMVATLGQQAIEGKRIANGFQHRTLPHFKRFDDSAQARGFIASSYIKGLQPDEFFFHAMAGREGLIDTAVKTADTGYLQRQIRVALEDLITQHDGSVRDATGNLVQIAYGEDGINATKLENQPLPLASLSDDDIRRQFEAEGVDAATQERYYDAITADRMILVEKVYQGKPQKSVKYAVHLDRMINSIANQLHLKENEGTVTAAEVLEAQGSLLLKTHANNLVWGALVRYHLAPISLKKRGYTKAALDALVAQAVLTHWKSWVEPGQPIGVIAAQSIGEPATQMSAIYSTKISIASKTRNYTGSIGAYVDALIAAHPEKVHELSKDSVVLDLDNGDEVVGVSNDEKTSWLPIKQVSRHPANGGIVEVRTRTGRMTKATLTHSFLKRTPMGIAPVLGSELKVGDRIPVAKRIPQVSAPVLQFNQGSSTFALNRMFGWICGIYLADGCLVGATVSISKTNPAVETFLHTFCDAHGYRFSTRNKVGAFGPSKDNNIHSADIRDFLEAHFGHGSFEKRIPDFAFHAPTEFIAGLLSGYFDGDGNVNVERQQIRLSSRNEGLMRDTNRLLGYCGLFGYLGQETSVRIPDAIQYTLNIPKSLIGVFQANVGLQLPEKAAALAEIATYKDREGKQRNQEVLDKIPALGELIAETGKLLALPGQSRNYGRWAKKESIGRETLLSYLPVFHEAAAAVADPVVKAKVAGNLHLLESAANADVFWDEITELVYHEDPHEFVYDFTVPGNDSFMVDDNILVHNTLNSVDFHTEIVIARDGQILTPKIGEFIDQYIAGCDESRIQRLPNDQLYVALDDGHKWQAASCDEHGEMMWTTLEAITKHPVVNDDGTDTILEVETESGRVVKATKGRSFLIHREGKIVDILGSELKVGDELPVANALHPKQVDIVEELDLSKLLNAKEWLFGDEVEKAVAALKKADADGNRHWFSHANTFDFTVPYNRSDTFRAAFTQGLNTRAAEFLPGFVYPKSTRSCTSQIPSKIPLTKEFGFFVGAFISEGSTSTTQIQITNNDDAFLAPIRLLLDGWKVGHHTVTKDVVIETTGIKGRTTSLIVHSTLLTSVFRQQFGVLSQNKTMPDWILQAPDAFVHGLIDGYFSGDGFVEASSGCINAGSTSEDLILRLSLLLSRYGIFGTHGSYMPELRKFKSVQRFYRLHILAKYGAIFANTFTLTSVKKQERLNAYKGVERMCMRPEVGSVVLDKVKSIKNTPPFGGKVYDVTVEKTKNFLLKNRLVLRDTFHLSGVASKSAMTRGVPRLKELMKSTKNPKAIELTIPLRKDLRDKKEEARRVAHELEFTLLQDIVTTARIYYDPRDSATLIREDADWLAYLAAFESIGTAAAAPQQPDPTAAAAEAAATAATAEPQSNPWILRFELDRDRMFAKNITMDDIAFLLKKNSDIKVLYTDYNASRLVFRIRLQKDGEDPSYDDLNILKAYQTNLMRTTALRGIYGIRTVNYQKVSGTVEFKDGKYTPVEQYVLTTDGSNFVDVLAHPDVDPTRVLSSNVHDIYLNLGIEAARATLRKEITTLFEESGSSVNYRHVCVLLDKICQKGRMMSIDRYGINKNDIGPLAKMSFEQTEDIVMRAALFGERDPCLGISAKVMLGAPIKAGTAFSEIMLDEGTALQLAASTPEQTVEGIRGRDGPGALSEEEIHTALYGEDTPGPCSLSELRMNVALPAPPLMAVPETMEDVEVVLLD